MENIFTAKDIKERLKQEHTYFKGVITEYVEIMKDIKTEKKGDLYL